MLMAEPKTETRAIQISDADKFMRIDMYLGKKYPQYSRRQWQDRISTGMVRLNGENCRSSRKLNAGDIISLAIPVREEPKVDSRFQVVYEDDYLLVINKPSGMPVHPSGIYRTQTLYNFLKAEKPYLSKIHLAHRLDRETSGLLVLARNPNIARTMQKMFASNGIYKEYRAVVHGSFPQKIIAKGFLSSAQDSRLTRKQKFNQEKPEGICKSAHTVFEKISEIEFHTENLSLLKAILFTGRHHQIRATLSGLGYPIVGDKLYGKDEDMYFRFSEGKLTEKDKAILLLDRCALHCHTLRFPHPVTEVMVSFCCDDMFVENLKEKESRFIAGQI